MALRDLLIISLVFGCAFAGFYRPWLGLCGYAWISYMNPHRFTWAFAYTFPVALVVVGATLAGMVLGRDTIRWNLQREGRLLLLLWLWFFVTTFTALNAGLAQAELIRVSKILLMTFVTMFLLTDRYRINVFLLVIIWSIGLLAIKGGLFVVLTGGQYRVYGPAGSFLEDNNDFAHALCMVLPFIIWKARMQIERKWKVFYQFTVIATIASVIITYSRGGFLTLVGVLGIYWLKSKRKMAGVLALVICLTVSIPFVPDAWFDRIGTIAEYEHDTSTLGRFNAWATGWNVFKDRPLTGGGFQTYTWKTFARYSPEPDNVHDVHSIYFEVLGEHGLPGTIIFFSMIASAMISAQKMKKIWARRKDNWASDLCDAVFISLAAYLGGGLFLGRASFDLFYHMIALVVVLKGMLKDQLLNEQVQDEDRSINDLKPSWSV